ncbi:AmpG family muropeptide MFS transporter [Neisseriaceae bacterium TC5R-5]|nr:AmpG family muropeptide MFS transporter [Neisseriaceae bacterium TC5R-5]
MNSSPFNWQRDIFSRNMLICVFTGFASGLPLYTLLNLLPAWLRSEGINLKTIGLFALIGLPYTWKFLWSPLLDRFALPRLGRRRGWMLLSQLALIVGIAAFGLLQPKIGMSNILMLASAVAFFSASQDIVLDAYRREILSEQELGLGNSVHVNAYRLAGLIPGSLALILADHLPWSSVFLITALFMLPGLLMTLVVSEPKLITQAPKTLRQAVVEPFHEFIHRRGWQHAAWILGFIFLYKLGDSMATALATPFYLDLGYSKSQIGLVAKNAGLWPAVIGGLLGGIWMMKLGINRALWLFGVVQVLSILGFVWLASFGHFDTVSSVELAKLGLVIGFEALGVGLGTAAFVAFIARCTHPAYTATQFALFTSLAVVPRTLVNASTGFMVEAVGWGPFFMLCTILALPGMLFLFKVAPWKQEEI